MVKTKNEITTYFSRLKVDPSWYFSASEDRSKATYVTHNYHRYPAKFIPQIVDKLIDEYTKSDSVVCDPFGGCGTTLVESKIAGRKSIGFDINPVAFLITKAKTTPIDPQKLEKCSKILFSRIENESKKNKSRNQVHVHSRLDFWFSHNMQKKLLSIYSPITRLRDEELKVFFLCGFSHILKNCSNWLMKSIKPTRDFEKKIGDPFSLFQNHIRLMIKKNRDYFDLLAETGNLRTKTKMKVADARNLPLKDNSIDLIVTSPPYVTSYEYADLHQLSLLWFNYTDDLSTFRKKFIGTSTLRDDSVYTGFISTDIIESLKPKNQSLASSVSNYFSDMNTSIQEMHRVLTKGGHVSLIIGNTALKGVKIQNAEVAYEQMIEAGFRPVKVIKRKLFNQMITPWRDKKTGRFTNLENRNKKKVYQYEYILVMKK